MKIGWMGTCRVHATSEVKMYEQVPNLLMCPNSFTHHFCVHVTVLPGYRKVPLDSPFIIQLGPHWFFVLKKVRTSRFSARLASTNLADTVCIRPIIALMESRIYLKKAYSKQKCSLKFHNAKDLGSKDS